MKLIKEILKNALVKQDFKGEVSLSPSKKISHGDYTSQVLLRHRVDEEALVRDLETHELIQKVVILNGHLNLYITEKLLEAEPCELKSKKTNRMRMIRNRLYDEQMTEGETPHYFLPLVKKTNELICSLKELNQSDGLEKELIDTFEKLDFGYVYRQLTKSDLGGIYQLLNTCLMVLERANDE
ncbi:MAG: hypothetical protein JEZ08_12565 [Clostridiales bacterium]|nr:hypothetical protein [Clostridiales bacterium]